MFLVVKVMNFTRKTQYGLRPLKEIIIKDLFNTKTKISIWGKNRNFENINENTVYSFHNIKVDEYPGKNPYQLKVPISCPSSSFPFLESFSSINYLRLAQAPSNTFIELIYSSFPIQVSQRSYVKQLGSDNQNQYEHIKFPDAVVTGTVLGVSDLRFYKACPECLKSVHADDNAADQKCTTCYKPIIKLENTFNCTFVIEKEDNNSLNLTAFKSTLVLESELNRESVEESELELNMLYGGKEIIAETYTKFGNYENENATIHKLTVL